MAKKYYTNTIIDDEYYYVKDAEARESIMALESASASQIAQIDAVKEDISAMDTRLTALENSSDIDELKEVFTATQEGGWINSQNLVSTSSMQVQKNGFMASATYLAAMNPSQPDVTVINESRTWIHCYRKSGNVFGFKDGGRGYGIENRLQIGRATRLYNADGPWLSYADPNLAVGAVSFSVYYDAAADITCVGLDFHNEQLTVSGDTGVKNEIFFGSGLILTTPEF